MNYDASSLKIICGIDAICRRPEMYVGPGGVRPQILATRLAGSALELGVSQVEVHRVGEWWIIASNEDWLAYHNKIGVLETFQRIVPIPHLVNSCRFEVVVYALAETVFTSKSAELLVLKGDEDDVRNLLSAHSLFGQLNEKRVVGFTLVGR